MVEQWPSYITRKRVMTSTPPWYVQGMHGGMRDTRPVMIFCRDVRKKRRKPPRDFGLKLIPCPPGTGAGGDPISAMKKNIAGLVKKFPWIVDQWSPNNDLSLDSPEIERKGTYLWVCEKGHEWGARLDNRCKNSPTGCPYCSGRLCAKEDSLEFKYPELTEQLLAAGNQLDPSLIHPGTVKKFDWKCAEGHIFNAAVRQRTLHDKQCPVCQSLAFNFPDLLDQWDFKKNSEDPLQVPPGSNKKVWWRCAEDHEWEAAIGSRVRGHGCPACAGLVPTAKNNFAVDNPDSAKYWDFDENDLPPSAYLQGSMKKCHFICEQGHKFSATLNNVRYGKWCPYCSGQKVGYGNSLQDTNPELASQWHKTKNKISPSEITAGSTKKAWWICENGHEWEAVISSRKRGNACPGCANRMVTEENSLGYLHPELASEIDQSKNKIDAMQLLAGTSDEIWWLCPRGHSYKAPVIRRSNGSGCRFCSSQTSLPEIRLFCEVKAVFPTAKNREKVSGYEADIFIPDLKLVIEYDGAYFHADNKEKDGRKKRALTKAGLTVIRVREEPLRCTGLDVSVAPGREALKKVDVDTVLKKILESYPRMPSAVRKYLKESGFVAESEYRRIVSFLPGPPDGETLADLHPELEAEWNYPKNDPLKPTLFHPGSGKRVWWICAKGHEWQATIDKRSRAGRGCPYCTNKKVGYGNSLADQNPEVAALWFDEANGDLTPQDVVVGSGHRVWWKCPNGHITRASVVERAVIGKQCPHCPGPGRNRKYTPPDPAAWS